MNADGYDVIPMTPAGLKKHLATWRNRVSAAYHIDGAYLTLDAHEVRERWKLAVRPETALRIAKRFGVPVTPL